MKEKVALYFYATHLGQITVKKHSQPTENRGAFFYPSTPPLPFFTPPDYTVYISANHWDKVGKKKMFRGVLTL